VVGELCPLDHDGEQGVAPLIDDRALLGDPGVDVVEQQRRASGHVDEPAPLGREINFAPEDADQIASEVQQGACGGRSAVDGGEPPRSFTLAIGAVRRCRV
jgi:hypothetical protein